MNVRSGVMLALLALGTATLADAKPPKKTPPKPASRPAEAGPAVDPKALDILKAMSARLTAAQTLSFTAVATEESPSRLGPALAYMTSYDVKLKRPDKLRIVTSGDGPVSEFYYDGKTITAYAPAEKLVAVAEAPPTIDAALRMAYESAATYFPFTDLIVADPYNDVAGGLTHAFVVGQSHLVGGTTTDVVALANDGVFAQIWIGADDKLPRLLRAVYAKDGVRLRHQVEVSNWRLDADIASDSFASPAASGASKIEFGRPDPQAPSRAGSSKGKPSKTPQKQQ